MMLQRAALLGLLFCVPVSADDARVTFTSHPESLDIRIGDATVARYVFADPAVPRPYFAPVSTRSGRRVTRPHPPVEGVDAVDHVGLHTGVWLSFGDLNGHDYWRLKSRTQHVRFAEPPTEGDGSGSFAVLNRYLSHGSGVVCEELCRYRVMALPEGYRLDSDSEFHAVGGELVFGDQEEMGLGVRMATELAVDRKQGSRLLDSKGRAGAKAIWGQTAAWCDYAGPLDGRWIGLTVLTHPDNFRPAWCHARDYGLLAMNPFGRKAFTQGEASRVVVAPGETLRLRYGVVVHDTPGERDYDVANAYRDYCADDMAALPPMPRERGKGAAGL